MTRPILYISGPYSAGNGRTVADNIAIARKYAVAAVKAGWMPLWLAGDLAILKHLEPGYDAMLVLPNWEQSAGTNLEVGWAKHIGLTILGPFDMAEEIPVPRRWIL